MALHLPERWLSDECVSAALGAPVPARPRTAAAPRGIGIPLFRNVAVDRFLARAHPAFPLVFFGPIVLALTVTAHHAGRASREVAAFAAGWLLLSFVEYVVHRFWFHHPASPSREGRIGAFLAHGYHHRYPLDATRLVLPPMVTLPLAVPTFLIAHLAFGSLGDVGFAGLVTGYIAYDSLHYLTHHSRARRGPLGWLRRYHLLHHNDRVPGRFGVSSPLWDLVLGTYLPATKRLSPHR